MRFSFSSRQTVLFVAAMIASSGTAFAAESVEVRLKTRASVGGAVITLGDVADVRHRDPATQSRLAGILVGPAPPAGGSVRVSFSSVRSHLRDYGVDLSRVRFSGSSVVSVTSGRPKQYARQAGHHRTLSGVSRDESRAQDAVAKAVQQYLGRAVPELGMVSVRVRIPASEVRNVLTAVNTGYNIRGGSAPWDRPQTFLVRFLDRSEKLHEVHVEGVIDRHPYVLAAKHVVPKGELIRAADLVWKQVAEVKAGDITQYRDAVGLESTRGIRPNESIGKANVRKVPLVRANELVTVYSARSGVRVARQMKSRGNGAAGETIKVATLDGRNQILVRVIGPREAEVISARQQSPSRFQDQSGSIRYVESDRSSGGPSIDRRRSPRRTARQRYEPYSRR